MDETAYDFESALWHDIENNRMHMKKDGEHYVADNTLFMENLNLRRENESLKRENDGLRKEIDGLVMNSTTTASVLRKSRDERKKYLDQNAKLREQMELLVTLLRNDCGIDASWDGLRKFWNIGLTEDGCLMRDRACNAEAENAKLRELVSALWWCTENNDMTCDTPCKCDHCILEQSNNLDPECEVIMREMGIAPFGRGAE